MSPRDYDKEYRTYQVKKKKYRAKLNKENRDRGTYGNGDGKDVSHEYGGGKGKTRLMSEHANRSFARTKKGKRKYMNKRYD